MSVSRYYFKILMIVLLGFTASCKPVYYENDIKEIDFLDTPRYALIPEQLDSCPIGIDDIISFGDYLFATVKDPSSQLRIYDVNNDCLIASIGSRGRANNEFISPQFVGDQVYIRDDELYLPVIDNMTILKEINVTESIKQSEAVVPFRTFCVGPAEGRISLLDNDITKTFVFVKPLLLNEKATQPLYLIKEEGLDAVRIPAFKDVIEGDNRVNVLAQYLGGLKKHPQRNVIVQPMQNMDYILFFDVDSMRYYAVHQLGSRTFEDKVIENINYSPSSYCFGDGAVSKDFFLVNYCARVIANPDDEVKTEILMFDWEGNFIKGFTANVAMHRITYNESNQTLYGCDLSNEKLYKVSLKDYL